MPRGIYKRKPLSATTTDGSTSTTNFAIRIVGYALTAEDLLFNPSNDYIVHI